MFHALLIAADDPNGFRWSNLVVLLVVAAIFYPIQKRIRATVSQRRKERWAEHDPGLDGRPGAAPDAGAAPTADPSAHRPDSPPASAPPDADRP